MTPQEIKADLAARGYSIKMLAEAMNKSTAAVGAVINRQLVALPTAEAIAKVLEKPVLKVFPDVESYQSPRRKEVRAEKKRELQRLLSA